MSTLSVRAFFTVALLFSIAGAIDGFQVGVQACGGAKQTYTAPGGSVVGQGTTKFLATEDAQRRARMQVGYSVSACASCPSFAECGSSVAHSWDSYSEGPPTWDSVLKVYTVSISWDCCDATQTCIACP